MTTSEDLACAVGKFAAFVASLLDRAGVAPMRETAVLLESFAETVAETDPAQGAILTKWATDIGASARH